MGGYNWGGRVCWGLITRGTYMLVAYNWGGRICRELITGGTYMSGAYNWGDVYVGGL